MNTYTLADMLVDAWTIIIVSAALWGYVEADMIVTWLERIGW